MINQQPMLLNQPEDITSLQGIRNVSPNGVFGNEVYGSNSEGFGVNPLSNEFWLCNSDELWSTNGGRALEIRGYDGGGGDMVLESTKSELVCSSYGQNSELVLGSIQLEFFLHLSFKSSSLEQKRDLFSGSHRFSRLCAGPEEQSKAYLPPIYVPLFMSCLPKSFLPEDDVLPAEEQPLPVAASPYEDIEEDPTDYPADRGHDRDDEEPSDGDDDDDDDDAEEEEHLVCGTLQPDCHSRADLYGFDDMLVARSRTPDVREELGYGITDTWDDLDYDTYILSGCCLRHDRAEEARVSRALGHTSMAACDWYRSEGISLRNYGHGLSSPRSTELQQQTARATRGGPVAVLRLGYDCSYCTKMAPRKAHEVKPRCNTNTSHRHSYHNFWSPVLQLQLDRRWVSMPVLAARANDPEMPMISQYLGIRWAQKEWSTNQRLRGGIVFAYKVTARGESSEVCHLYSYGNCSNMKSLERLRQKCGNKKKKATCGSLQPTFLETGLLCGQATSRRGLPPVEEQELGIDRSFVVLLVWHVKFSETNQFNVKLMHCRNDPEVSAKRLSRLLAHITIRRMETVKEEATELDDLHKFFPKAFDKGSIRPSSHHRELQFYSSKKKDDRYGCGPIVSTRRLTLRARLSPIEVREDDISKDGLQNSIMDIYVFKKAVYGGYTKATVRDNIGVVEERGVVCKIFSICETFGFPSTVPQAHGD
ncbi:hypothetical protein Tco_0359506 [Tanacetum coccineum]